MNPIGIKGEQYAVSFLERKGYRVTERNFRKHYGEIDIISVQDHTLVFVEVKTRTSTKFGTGIEAISYFKLRSLIKTAMLYKKIHPQLPDALRIDAISVLLSKNGDLLDIDHRENIAEVCE